MNDGLTSLSSSSKTPRGRDRATVSHRAPVPVQRQRVSVAKKPSPKRILGASYRRAQILINRATGVWSDHEIAELRAIRFSVRKALESLPARDKRNAFKFLRALDRINSILQCGKAKGNRNQQGDPTRHEHPDRNRITEFKSAGGRIRWATSKR